MVWVVKKNTMNKYYNTGKTEHIRLVIISNWAICVKKKTRFIKDQENRSLLSNLGVRAPLSKSFKDGRMLCIKSAIKL